MPSALRWEHAERRPSIVPRNGTIACLQGLCVQCEQDAHCGEDQFCFAHFGTTRKEQAVRKLEAKCQTKEAQGRGGGRGTKEHREEEIEGRTEREERDDIKIKKEKPAQRMPIIQ